MRNSISKQEEPEQNEKAPIEVISLTQSEKSDRNSCFDEKKDKQN